MKDRFLLTPDIRRQVEGHVEKAIMRVHDDLNWTPEVWDRRDLKIRMECVRRLRDEIISSLIKTFLSDEEAINDMNRDTYWLRNSKRTL